MAYEIYSGDRQDRKAYADYLLRIVHSARMARVNFDAQWEEAAALAWPEYRNSFALGHVRAPGVKYTQYQVDSYCSIAAWRFMCIGESMGTPATMMWSKISADNPDLLRDRSARLYFDEWTQLLWRERYRPDANFHAQQQLNWMCLGVFGGQNMFVEEIDTHFGAYRPGLRYVSYPPGSIYLLRNYQGRVNGCILHLRWTARAIAGKWPDAIPPSVQSALDRSDEVTLFDILQFILPRTDYDAYLPFSPRGKRWSSTVLSYRDKTILEDDKGYSVFPLAHGGWQEAPEEDYERGPTQQVLAALKTRNAMEEAQLRTAVESGNPIRLVGGDDGEMDYKRTAGADIFGGLDDEGRPRVQNLQPGSYEINEKALLANKQTIDAAYLLDLFPEIGREDNKTLSPRDLLELSNQRMVFAAPGLGKQFSYLSDMIRLEMRVLQQLGRAPQMPPVVREARGDFMPVMTSPLGLAMHGQEIAGFMDLHNMAAQMAQADGDASHFDQLDYDAFFPDAAEYRHVPVRWTPSPAQLAAKRRQRAQQAQQENYVRSLPGLAARDKAQAIVAKSQTGGNIGGTLSGMAPGGMPVLPANPRGQPGRPGFSGVPAR